MNLDPSENHILITGSLGGVSDLTILFVLSLKSETFCRVLSSTKMNNYYEFGIDRNWYDSHTLILGSELHGCVVLRMDNSNVFGFKVAKLGLKNEEDPPQVFDQGYCRGYSIVGSSKGAYISHLSATSLSTSWIQV
jgi:hypothetical protein